MAGGPPGQDYLERDRVIERSTESTSLLYYNQWYPNPKSGAQLWWRFVM